MSVLGIDIGTSYCVLATIQRGAVSIVRNDLSERLTPALVSFTEKERLIGEGAQSQLRSNFRNTARNIKQLLGVARSDVEAFRNECQFSLSELDFTNASEGSVAGYKVMYKGEQRIFTATRCMAALLTKLREIGEKSVGGPIRDVVISVPGWFSEPARQAMLDAAEVAGLNCLRAMNEHAAVALDYGIYRSNTFDAEKASRVAFVGVGHGAANVFVADFVKGELRMLAVSSDKTIGGRDFDRAIIKHFSKQFERKQGLNPLESPKALLKLEDAATKAKKILSANTEAPFNIECLMEDHDLNGMLTRQDFEALCDPYRLQLMELLKTTFEQNGLLPSSVHSVELVGGCTRIPWIQDAICTFFENRLPLSKTLNMDETVARGCALQAAMLNPRYRVREFAVVDRAFEPITLSWFTNAPEPQRKTSVLFEKGSPLGTKKWLTFQRSSPFELRLTAGETGQPLVSMVEPPTEADAVDPSLPRRYKLKARLSHNGIVFWEAAQLLIDEEVEELVKEKRPAVQASTATSAPDQVMADATEETAATTMTDVGGVDSIPPPPTDKPEAPPQLEEMEVLKKKLKTRRFECVVRSLARDGYLQVEAKAQLRECEVAMAADDRAQQEAKELMNTLESYIYRMRDRLQGVLADFVSPADKQRFAEALTTTESWVYDNPEGNKEVYAKKFEELKALGDPVEYRYSEFERRKEGLAKLAQVLAELQSAQTSPQWAHVPEEKMRILMQKLSETERWMNNVAAQINAVPFHVDPVCKSAEFFAQGETLINFSKTVLVPKPEEKPAPGNEPVEETSAAKPEDTLMENGNPTTTEASDVPIQ